MTTEGGRPSSEMASTPDAGPRITIDTFMEVDLRVARVIAAEKIEKSKRLIKLVVDLGSEQRTVVAGIAEAYEPVQLVGRTVVVVANLEPARLMGVDSDGMVLAASLEDGKPALVQFNEPAPQPGTRVR